MTAPLTPCSSHGRAELRGQSGTAATAPPESEQHTKKARFTSDESTNTKSPLDKDKDATLDAVFSFVGIGEYAYAAGVNRRWRGLYVKLCHTKAAPDKKGKLTTTYKSAVMTTERLKLALKSSLSMAALQTDPTRLALHVTLCSLEPIAVLSLARVRGLAWHECFPTWAARYGKLDLLKWLHESGCQWDEQLVCICAARRGLVDMLNWLQSVTAPWSVERKQQLLFDAGWSNQLAAVQWLSQQGAPWPSSVLGTSEVRSQLVNKCWQVHIICISYKFMSYYLFSAKTITVVYAVC
jgi:hypothetical protein